MFISEGSSSYTYVYVHMLILVKHHHCVRFLHVSHKLQCVYISVLRGDDDCNCNDFLQVHLYMEFQSARNKPQEKR